jgi:hypothetical protein
MHLVRCASPQEPLEVAPRTALLADRTEGECWDGFWSAHTDAYFVRCTKTGGEIEWFKLADDVADPRAHADQRVLTLRGKSKASARVAVVVAQSPSGRRMLVGHARRTTR